MKSQRRIVSEIKTASAPWLFAGLFGLVLIPVSILAALNQFDGLYGQDPYAYYDYAIGPLREGLRKMRGFPVFFWPPGYPLLVSLTSFIVGIRPFAGQLVSLLAGSLIPIFAALFAREVCGDSTKPLVPITAGVITALTPQLWQSSAVVMADTTGLAAATFGVWSLSRYGKHPVKRSHWLFLATLGLSFAIFSRWAYALVAIPCVIYTIVNLRTIPRRPALVQILGAALTFSVVLWPIFPPLTQLPEASDVWDGTTSFTGNLIVYSWNPINAFRREFVTGGGFLRYALPNGIYYALAPAHRFFFTPLLALFLFPGLWSVVRTQKRELLLLVIGWPLIVYTFHAGAPLQNFRFTLAYLPPLALLAAIGVNTVLHWVPRALWIVPIGVFVVGILWMVHGGWSLTSSFAARKSAELNLARAVEAIIPENAHLITFGVTLTIEHYTSIQAHDIFVLSPDEMGELIESSEPAFLLLELENIQTQWIDRTPSKNYLWLRANHGLVEIQSLEMEGLAPQKPHVFTLFQVIEP